MSTPANSVPRGATGRWPRWAPLAGWSVLGVLGATLLVFIATITFGAVHGTEFCPQTFERRSYSYYELPLVGWQMTGEQHEDLTGDTELTITSNNLLPPATSPKKDWHVLMGSRGTRLRRPGDAGILVRYLEATEDGSNHRWDNWTEENKEQAKVLWPAVQRLAIHDQYVFVPDLFDLAKNNSEPKLLKEEIDRTLAWRLLFVAQIQERLGNPAGATKSLNEAVALDPKNADVEALLTKLRHESAEASTEPAAATN